MRGLSSEEPGHAQNYLSRPGPRHGEGNLERSGRPSRGSSHATATAPLFSPASTMTVASERSVMVRFRMGKSSAVTSEPGANWQMTRCSPTLPYWREVRCRMKSLPHLNCSRWATLKGSWRRGVGRRQAAAQEGPLTGSGNRKGFCYTRHVRAREFAIRSAPAPSRRCRLTCTIEPRSESSGC